MLTTRAAAAVAARPRAEVSGYRLPPGIQSCRRGSTWLRFPMRRKGTASAASFPSRLSTALHRASLSASLHHKTGVLHCTEEDIFSLFTGAQVPPMCEIWREPL